MSFGSPACDYGENNLDLNRYLSVHPVSCYFMRMRGNALAKSGIFDGDILLVDRSLPPTDNRLIIAELNGRLLARRYRRNAGKIRLQAEDASSPVIFPRPEDQFSVWGVITSVIRKV
mgnify:FL=1